MIYEKILIATDGSELAGRAVAHGLKLAKELKVPVVVVTVTQVWSALEIGYEARLTKADPIERYRESAAALAQRILDEAGDQAKAAGVRFELVHVPESAPAEGIIATAEKQGCDLIVMASNGRRGLGRFLLGSQANEVLVYSKVPALIVR
jgi:nucleotide-binding universal stress UspA family protein